MNEVNNIQTIETTRVATVSLKCIQDYFRNVYMRISYPNTLGYSTFGPQTATSSL